MKLATALQKIGFWISLSTTILLPLFFLPVTSEFYEFNKLALLVVSTAILLLLLTTEYVIQRQVRILRSPFGLPLLILALTWIVSTFLKTPNRVDAFIQPGNTSTIVAFVLFFTATINLVRSRRELDLYAYAFLGSLALLSIISIVWGSGLTDKIIPVAFLKNPVWSPTGNPLGALVVLATTLPYLAIHIIKEKTGSPKILFLTGCLFLNLIGAAVIGYRLFTPDSPNRSVFLPHSTAWSIALESIKSSPLFGTGPTTFISDFTRFRPVSFNTHPNWNIRFSSSSNYYLHVLTTVGLAGLAAYLFLVSKSLSLFIKSLRSPSESPLYISVTAALVTIILLFIVQIFLPSSFILTSSLISWLILTTLFLKHFGSSLVHEANIDLVAASESGHRSPLLPPLSLVLVLALVLPTLYLGARAYWAEVLFQKALTAAAKNDGKTTYDTLIAAMSANPRVDSYRVAYSQANLLIANSLAVKKDMTDDDRKTIVQLIQQSIREAKNAVALNPAKAANVENLAAVYRNLLNLAQGADQWTLASYQQAIQLDPTNPNLRIALGGLYFAGKNYDESIKLFQQAADLKPDLANAHYNLAAAYREKGDLQRALVSLQNVVNSLDRTSADYTKASGELAELQQKVNITPTPIPVTATESELVAPKPLPSPKISPPIQLSEDLGPNATPSSTPNPN
ncbi:MAG: glycosyl transferase family protein [Microgenomates group bacterium Gr01-1014_16]|nr:MAG: glycosyl transferase family protein [Microgenomates group bacterium Gr01-1014_16]